MIFLCLVAAVLDGDTLVCTPDTAGQEIRVRLSGIDAPELPGHCRRSRKCADGDPFAAWAALTLIGTGQTLRCTETGRTYDRIAAWCESTAAPVPVPLSCAMLATGHAVRWERYWPKGRACDEQGSQNASRG